MGKDGISGKDHSFVTDEGAVTDARSPSFYFLEFMADHLSDCSRRFSGDLTQVLILAILDLAYRRAQLNSPANPCRDSQRASASVTASWLAKVSGLPRETVRRKLFSLADRGWVRQNNDATWRLVDKKGQAVAHIDLSDLDRRALQRMFKLVQRAASAPAGQHSSPGGRNADDPMAS